MKLNSIGQIGFTADEIQKALQEYVNLYMTLPYQVEQEHVYAASQAKQLLEYMALQVSMDLMFKESQFNIDEVLEGL